MEGEGFGWKVERLVAVEEGCTTLRSPFLLEKSVTAITGWSIVMEWGSRVRLGCSEGIECCSRPSEGGGSESRPRDWRACECSRVSRGILSPRSWGYGIWSWSPRVTLGPPAWYWAAPLGTPVGEGV